MRRMGFGVGCFRCLVTILPNYYHPLLLLLLLPVHAVVWAGYSKYGLFYVKGIK